MRMINSRDVLASQALADDIDFAYEQFIARHMNGLRPDLLKRINDNIEFLNRRKDWRDIERKIMVLMQGRPPIEIPEDDTTSLL